MLHFTLLLLGFCIVTPLEIDPDLHFNQLRFPWGTNFKYHGQLHHNLARMWVVTKFNLPPINKFYFYHPPITPDCNFNISLNQTQKKPSKKRETASSPSLSAPLSDTFYQSRLRRMCEHSLPLFSLIQKREQFNRDQLINLVENDLYGTLHNLRTSQRSKRSVGLVISTVTGLVTLAVEAVGGYLQKKRNKAMAIAVDALRKAQLESYDKLQRHREDLLLYGTYSLKSTNAVLDTLQGMYTNQASLSDSLTHLDGQVWPILYSSTMGTSLYSSHLAMHAFTAAHRVDFLYQLLTEKIQRLVKGIATLSKGYLPPELFPPSFLRNISSRVAQELHKDHLSYKLAFEHESAYYDMPLATFSLDKDMNLIVTFPIFIVPFNHEPLSLFEIETVPVPINDQDPSAQSYSEVQVQKPYFAASDTSYIQLRSPELFRCKTVQNEYFCEETFMVKHPHHHTCESALYYNRSAELITAKCPFLFYHNRTITPSVLDGGDRLVLANVPVRHSPTCDPTRLTSLPKGTYSLTNRDILCNCTLQVELAFLPSDLGACNGHKSHIHFKEQSNIAFDTIFHDLLENSTHPPPTLDPANNMKLSHFNQFSINLTLPHNLSDHIDSLSELHAAFAQNISEAQKYNSDPYILSRDYQEKMQQIEALIGDQDQYFLGILNFKFCAFLSFLISLINMIIIGLLVKKYERLQTMTAALTILKTAHAISDSQIMAPNTHSPTEQPVQTEVICYDPLISGVLTGISTLSVIIVIWQQWKNKNLCRGYLYTNLFEIKLILGEATRYLPLKLRKMAGPLHRVGINMIPTPRQISLIHGWMWDTLTIDWTGILMTSGNETIQLPSTIIVPIRAKFKLRQILGDPSFTVSMALTQDNNWYDLSQSSQRMHTTPSACYSQQGATATPPQQVSPAPRPPESRPLLNLVNTRTNPSSDDSVQALSNMERQN